MAMNVSADETAGGARGKLSHAPSDVPIGVRRELHLTPKPAKSALKRSVGTPSQDAQSADRRPSAKYRLVEEEEDEAIFGPPEVPEPLTPPDLRAQYGVAPTLAIGFCRSWKERLGKSGNGACTADS